MQTTLTVRGTHCAACKALIEDVCKDTPGITACEVDFQTGKTVIEHDPSINMDALKQEIKKLGEY